MELNRDILVGLIDEACVGDIAVYAHWPGGSKGEGFFVMSERTESLLRDSKSTAVLSSRLPKILDDHRNWFDAIRTIGTKVGRANSILLTSESTTADRYVRRIAELFRINCVAIEQLPVEKLKGELKTSRFSDSSTVPTIYLVASKKVKSDLLLGQLADTLYALSVRKGGNVEGSLARRLSSDQPSQSTFLLRDETLTKDSVRDPLISDGAIDWLLVSNDPDAPKDPTAQSKPRINRRLQLSDLRESEYLIHWTRARSGAWPDQTEADHLDDLIFGASGGRHNDVSALCRIIASQRIIASSNLTRDASPVVCFSDVPLSQLRDRTVFRKHLGRWDFLPFGIAIKREILMRQFDCRSVIYGDDDKWETLSEEDRPLFQIGQSGDKKIDWQQEREWRVIGDVDLRKINLEDAIVFVGDENDLEKLSQLSLFDLIVI